MEKLNVRFDDETKKSIVKFAIINGTTVTEVAREAMTTGLGIMQIGIGSGKIKAEPISGGVVFK